MILFVYTETTGLPDNYKAPSRDIGEWPRLIEIGYILTDDNGDILARRNLIVKPGFEIPTEASDIHGITTQKAQECGVRIRYVLKEFASYVDKVDLVIAHNYAFDSSIIGAEYIRLFMNNPLTGKKSFCTCDNKAIIQYCKLPNKWNSGLKWPKLQELHVILFGVEFDGAHGALADIQATVSSYFELKKREII